jgi:hypothetical protein
MKKQLTLGLATAAVALLMTTLVSSFRPECPPDKFRSLIPNPDNCNAYYECINWSPILMLCPPGLYFCAEKEVCSWPDDEWCTYDCVPPNGGGSGGGGGKLKYFSIPYEDKIFVGRDEDGYLLYDVYAVVNCMAGGNKDCTPSRTYSHREKKFF